MTKLHRNVWVTSITSFLTDVSSEMIFNLLPLFLANVLGVRTALIGVVEGTAESLSSLLKIVSGLVSDLAGQRKWLAVLGYTVSSVAKPFLYVAGSWSAVLGVRAADRIGKGIRTAPRDALLAASVRATERGRAFGIHRAFDTAGAVTGLVAAFAVVWAVQKGRLTLELETFRLVVLTSLFPAFVAVIVLAFGAQEIVSTRSEGQRAPDRPSLRGLDPSFYRFLVAVVLFTLGNSSDAFLVLRAQERGLSVLGILGMLIGFNLVYSLVSAPAGRLSDVVGRKGLIATGWCLYAVLYLGFALADEAWHIVALFVLYGLYYGLAEGVARAYVADLVGEERRRGTAFGLYHAAVGFSALPASLMAGLLWQGAAGWQGLGPSAPFFLGASLAFAAVLILTLSVDVS